MKKQVIVAMGGPSAEHEVSLATGWEILKHLDKTKYLPRILIISQDTQFYYSDTDCASLSEQEFSVPQESDHFTGPVSPAQSQDIWAAQDIVVLALHGEFGEDGRFQGFLDTIGIPYTGSTVFASAVGMEKIASKYLFEQQGFTTPPYSIYKTDGSGSTIDAIIQKHGFPCYVKCPQSGSSRLMGRADSPKDLEALLKQLAEHAGSILIESNIEGEEYSCPVLEFPDGTAKALPPILIRPVQSSYFDYTAKYTAGACEEIVPAPCSEELTKRMQKLAVQAHTVLRCNGLSRTDMIVRENTVYVLETNTLPGLTSGSLVPKAFIATGGTYTELLDILIETSLAGRMK